MSELFYRMKHAKTDSSYYDRNLVPRAQVVFVKEVSDYITKNLNTLLSGGGEMETKIFLLARIPRLLAVFLLRHRF